MFEIVSQTACPWRAASWCEWLSCRVTVSLCDSDWVSAGRSVTGCLVFVRVWIFPFCNIFRDCMFVFIWLCGWGRFWGFCGCTGALWGLRSHRRILWVSVCLREIRPVWAGPSCSGVDWGMGPLESAVGLGCTRLGPQAAAGLTLLSATLPPSLGEPFMASALNSYPWQD